jgi:hypothetical protein
MPDQSLLLHALSEEDLEQELVPVLAGLEWSFVQPARKRLLASLGDAEEALVRALRLLDMSHRRIAAVDQSRKRPVDMALGWRPHETDAPSDPLVEVIPGRLTGGKQAEDGRIVRR